jgi:hypothetical protein
MNDSGGYPVEKSWGFIAPLIAIAREPSGLAGPTLHVPSALWQTPDKARRQGPQDPVLGDCEGRRTVREVEQTVLQNNPDAFSTSGEISNFVARLSGRDTC